MKNRTTKQNRLFNQDGFTLIELLLVVIILGILAAVVLPQFGTSSEDAKLSALKSNLATVRQALELYAIQHNGNYPDQSDDYHDIVNKLTLFSNASGTTSTASTSEYPYGPYIKSGLPSNPFVVVSGDAIYVDTTETDLGAFDLTSSGDQGWYYNQLTGEFFANDSDAHAAY